LLFASFCLIWLYLLFLLLNISLALSDFVSLCFFNCHFTFEFKTLFFLLLFLFFLEPCKLLQLCLLCFKLLLLLLNFKQFLLRFFNFCKLLCGQFRLLLFFFESLLIGYLFLNFDLLC